MQIAVRAVVGFVIAACCGRQMHAAQSTWVWRGTGGSLDYRTQADGDRIPDFSMVGYGAGWTDLPATPPVVVTVTATTGDTTSRIQAAINSAAALPLQATGYRGTVQLAPGDYEIAGQLKITASGVVLRGAGRDLASGSASRLIATGTSTRDVISIGSTSPRPNHTGFSKIAIADARVPGGATSFAVASTTGLSVGHTINVNWTSNQAWIDANGMNLLANPWQPGDRQQNSDRVITRIEGNRVFLDAPITSAIETIYGGGTIQRYSGFSSGGRITNVGLENLVGQSLATRDELNEARAWSFVGVEAAENVFVRDVEARHFTYSAVNAKDYSKFVTTSNARSLLASGTITGSRRYTYNVDGQLALVIDSTASDGRHDFVNGSNTAGPSAFVNGTASNAHNDSGPHHRWSSGILFDTLTVSGDAINIRDRGNSGTGHGWAGANSVVWNSKADSFIVQNPPTAQNWLIGSVGRLVTEGGKVGTYDSLGTHVSLGDTATNPTDSLYKAQLAERRSTGSDLRFWVGDQGTSWTSGTGGWTNWSRTLGTRTNSTVPSARTDVVFNVAGSTPLTTRPGIDTAVNSVQFDASTAPLTLRVGGTSGKLTLGEHGITVFSGSQTITGDAGGSGTPGDVLLAASQVWEVRGTSQLVVNARLGTTATSIGTLAKTGSGTLTLGASSGGVNSFKTAWAISQGIVRVTNADALGFSHNDAAVDSGAALQLAGVGLGIANGTLTLRGLGVSGSGGALRSLSGTTTLASGGGAIVLATGSTGIGVDAGILTISRTVSGTGGLVKTGSGRLVLAGPASYSGGTTLTAGTLDMASPPAAGGQVTITGGTMTWPVDSAGIVAVAGLSVTQAARGKLDLGASRIDVAAGGISLVELKADILAGRGGGLWSGTGGITSSLAASAVAAGRDRAVGWLANGDGSLSVGYAAAGDTNLDGLVDVLDAANIVAGNRFDTGSPVNWQDGDFNYDGLLDILDIGDFLGTGLYDTGGYLPVAAPQIAAVPEPGLPSLALAAVCLACACRGVLRQRAKMTRVALWKQGATLAMVLTGAIGTAAAAAESGSGVPKPNIIVILADDLGIGNVGCYNADAFRTPHLDALAAGGIRFQQCYSAPNCGPARALMMTGRYGFRTGMTGNDKPAVALLEAGRGTEVMLPQLLKPHGYATASAGKWSQIPLQPSDWGFDEYIRTKGSGAYWPTDDRDTFIVSGVEKPWPQGTYMPVLTEQFVFDFIDRHRDGPFYVHYSLAAVHTDMLPTPDTVPGSADSADLFAENIAFMDKLVGRLMAELDRQGLRDRTLVIFAGDNGTTGKEAPRSTIGGRRLAGEKGTLLEGGSRVPLVASWPGQIPPGRICDDLVGLVDVLPTLADVAGAPLPGGSTIDGRSFAPQLRGDAGRPREWVFVMLGRHWYVRDAGWKLTDRGELFDMRDAPFAEHPVEPDSNQAGAVEARHRLQAVLAELDPASGRLGDESGKKAGR